MIIVRERGAAIDDEDAVLLLDGNREERRREILGAFARVLAEHGYAGATIASIAAEARVAAALVHHHFDSKAELRCWSTPTS